MAERVVRLVEGHPAVAGVRLVGSRAEGRANARSDWDFRVDARDFDALAESLPPVLAPLEPLVQQWDRLSPTRCWMAIVPGPVKIDLIFPDVPHALEPPWELRAETIAALDAHFWDWMLWLAAKHERGSEALIAAELEKLFVHLLEPLHAMQRPSSIAEAVAAYRSARANAERDLGVSVSARSGGRGRGSTAD